jgi:hypothetical protein
MISTGTWEDFHRYMELLSWAHETVSMVTWIYFLGSMETFHWAEGYHSPQLNTSCKGICTTDESPGEVGRVSE